MLDTSPIRIRLQQDESHEPAWRLLREAFAVSWREQQQHNLTVAAIQQQIGAGRQERDTQVAAIQLRLDDRLQKYGEHIAAQGEEDR